MDIEKWAAEHPIGSELLYMAVASRPDDCELVTIASEPWTLGDGRAVVKLKDHSGCVSLEHLVPDEEITVLTISLGGTGFTVPWSQREEALEPLATDAEEQADEDLTTYEIRVHRMTRGALAGLPEFDGF